MASPLIVALDIGTSSARAIAFNLRGEKAAAEAQIPYDQTTTPDGGVEVDANFLLDLAARCLDQLLPQLQGEVAAVGISCFWHSLLAVDDAGNARTGVLSWADNRAAAWIHALRARLHEDEVHARTGCVFHTSYWPAKLLWLRDERPELFDQPSKWLGFGDFLAHQWFGAARVSVSMASGTGLLDQNTCDWDQVVLDVLPIERDQLPEITDLPEPLPPLRADLAARWPALGKAKWFPALGDGACSNIGSGCIDPTRIGLNAGTSGAMRVVLPDFKGTPPRGLWRYRVDRKRTLLGGAISNAGNALAWARGVFNVPENWPEIVGAMEPTAHQLTVLPFLAGERSPLWNADARFVLEGASLATDANQIVRAVLEAAALRYAAIGHLLLGAAPGAQIVFSGGALEKVPVWQAILCDAIGVPLLQSTESEASAKGAALLAMEAAGLIGSLAEIPFGTGLRLEPSPEHTALYTKALEQQNSLYEKIYRVT